MCGDVGNEPSPRKLSKNFYKLILLIFVEVLFSKRQEEYYQGYKFE